MTTNAAGNALDADTLVIGAGLAGLSCAVRLHEAGHRVLVLVLEASDAPGGRVRTDQVDGFLLDRGFQVFLDAPAGKSLVCASVLGDHRVTPELESTVRRELVDWFGPGTVDWQLLRMETIRKALPAGPPGHRRIHDEPGPVFPCGDFTTSGSIEGVIISGVRTADRILAQS